MNGINIMHKLIICWCRKIEMSDKILCQFYEVVLEFYCEIYSLKKFCNPISSYTKPENDNKKRDYDRYDSL